MKKLLIYYFVILSPFVLLIYCSKNNLIDAGWFVALLFFYCFIYRAITDYFRLRNKNVIGKDEFWKCFIPVLQMKYFRELYLI